MTRGRKRRERPGRVYVVLVRDGVHKIGYSVNPGQRAKSVSKTHPVVLYHSALSERPRRIEMLAHWILKNAGKHVEKELFAATLDECIAAVAHAQRAAMGLARIPPRPPRKPKIFGFKSMQFRLPTDLVARMDAEVAYSERHHVYPLTRGHIIHRGLELIVSEITGVPPPPLMDPIFRDDRAAQ